VQRPRWWALAKLYPVPVPVPVSVPVQRPVEAPGRRVLPAL
jgi:hypothetical protein